MRKQDGHARELLLCTGFVSRAVLESDYLSCHVQPGPPLGAAGSRAMPRSHDLHLQDGSLVDLLSSQPTQSCMRADMKSYSGPGLYTVFFFPLPISAGQGRKMLKSTLTEEIHSVCFVWEKKRAVSFLAFYRIRSRVSEVEVLNP